MKRDRVKTDSNMNAVDRENHYNSSNTSGMLQAS